MMKKSTQGADPALRGGCSPIGFTSVPACFNYGLALFLSRVDKSPKEGEEVLGVCPSSTAFLSRKDELRTLHLQTTLDFPAQ